MYIKVSRKVHKGAKTQGLIIAHCQFIVVCIQGNFAPLLEIFAPTT